MAIKTISLELDAYEKLKRAKRGRESFSAVIRRATFDEEESTGNSILKETTSLYQAKRPVTKKNLAYWDQAESDDRDDPRISQSAWDT
jgi:predicted CopG family antitoxin